MKFNSLFMVPKSSREQTHQTASATRKCQNRGLVVIATLVLLVATTGAVYAQPFTKLYDFGSNSGDPQLPSWPGVFAQGRDGNLYSTSTNGGAHGAGAVFRLTPAGTMTVVYSFTGNVTGDGGYPYSGLTLGVDGSLYGTTFRGGKGGYGTVFKVTTDGAYTLLHSLNGTTEGTGFSNTAAPIQAKDGNFYGTISNGNSNYGTFYKMTTAGVMTVLYQFGINGSTVRYPHAIIQGTDGNFYGTCGWTATNGLNGAVFKVTAAGKLTVLHIFTGTDGSYPDGPIIQASDGNLYGTTVHGGKDTNGTIYKVTPTGGFQVLFNFPLAATLGINPFAGLVQATDGKFYGATYNGGNGNCGAQACYGVLYQFTSAGTYTPLYNFLLTTVGTHPVVSLFQHTSGTFYSDTYEGGTGTGCPGPCGILYSLDMGLGSFVSFLPAQSAGKVGKNIGISGQGLNGTTKVSFSGASATFTIVSDSFVTATVPNGAKTGPISVTASGSALKSNKVFRVTPQITSFTPASGPPGTVVTITGVSLSQMKTVTFGGVKATSFLVVNDSTVKATVPSGAVTGKIAITTAGGRATSTTPFTVT